MHFSHNDETFVHAFLHLFMSETPNSYNMNRRCYLYSVLTNDYNKH